MENRDAKIPSYSNLEFGGDVRLRKAKGGS